VLGEMGDLLGHGPRFAHIVKNNHKSRNTAGAIMDGGRGVLNGHLVSVTPEENAIGRQDDRAPFANFKFQTRDDALARRGVDHLKDVRQLLS